jgi:hypothetical protein
VRVVLYTHHSLFEPALCLAAALADLAEVHLLMEVPATNDQVAHFEAGDQTLSSGRVDADAVLAPFYSAQVRAMWRRTASFQLVVTGAHRARDPRSLHEMREVLAWVGEIQADVLHIDDVDVSSRLGLALAVSRRPCPIVLGCHDPEPHSDERHWRLKRLTRALMLPRAAAYVVHHRAGLEALRRHHPRLRHPIHVVRLGAYTFLSHQPAPRRRAGRPAGAPVRTNDQVQRPGGPVPRGTSRGACGARRPLRRRRQAGARLSTSARSGTRGRRSDRDEVRLPSGRRRGLVVQRHKHCCVSVHRRLPERGRADRIRVRLSRRGHGRRRPAGVCA